MDRYASALAPYVCCICIHDFRGRFRSFPPAAEVREALNTKKNTEEIVTHKLKYAHNNKDRKRKVEDRGGGGVGGRDYKRDGLHVKGQNVISLIEYSLRHEKNRVILSPHSPFRRSDTLLLRQREDIKTRLKIHPKVGSIFSSGQLASRKPFFSPPSTNREHGRIILCLSASFLYPPFDFLFV